ncbi:YdhK family protein [Metabacillus litoralis]|uniref:YdhK family protein n=1 Tax=Metabacillus litoralis TaxID=152268 RepID=UPI001CFE2541|nr:YdhK family protein [Metabacillus litoralis]
MREKLGIGIVTLILAIFLSACANNDDKSSEEKNSNYDHNMEIDHSEMNHSDSGDVPEGLKVEENSTYKVGSQAILDTDHMKGMKGAEATIVGAYDTNVYVVSYTPTTGGERVEDHKWVIHEEIENAGNEPFQSGEEVVLNTEHMEGMKGATAVVDSVEDMTVYMVDYTPTTGGEEVKNHKWVTESELSPK